MGVHWELRQELGKLTTGRLKICCVKVNQKNALLTGVENQWHELKISMLVENRNYTSCFQCHGRVSLYVISHFWGKGNEWLPDAVVLG